MAEAILPETYWRGYVLLFRGNRAHRLAAGELDWADDEVREALGDPVKAVGLLVRLADAAPDEQALAYLGAGAVEDLLATLLPPSWMKSSRPHEGTSAFDTRSSARGSTTRCHQLSEIDLGDSARRSSDPRPGDRCRSY